MDVKIKDYIKVIKFYTELTEEIIEEFKGKEEEMSVFMQYFDYLETKVERECLVSRKLAPHREEIKRAIVVFNCFQGGVVKNLQKIRETSKKAIKEDFIREREKYKEACMTIEDIERKFSLGEAWGKYE
jgi:hypothetical protein